MPNEDYKAQDHKGSSSRRGGDSKMVSENGSRMKSSIVSNKHISFDELLKMRTAQDQKKVLRSTMKRKTC